MAQEIKGHIVSRPDSGLRAGKLVMAYAWIEDEDFTPSAYYVATKIKDRDIEGPTRNYNVYRMADMYGPRRSPLGIDAGAWFQFAVLSDDHQDRLIEKGYTIFDEAVREQNTED